MLYEVITPCRKDRIDVNCIYAKVLQISNVLFYPLNGSSKIPPHNMTTEVFFQRTPADFFFSGSETVREYIIDYGMLGPDRRLYQISPVIKWKLKVL